MYLYEAAPAFWRSYRKLTPAQQQAAKQAWQIFKRDPFDSRLRTHKIHASHLEVEGHNIATSPAHCSVNVANRFRKSSFHQFNQLRPIHQLHSVLSGKLFGSIDKAA